MEDYCQRHLTIEANCHKVYKLLEGSGGMQQTTVQQALADGELSSKEKCCLALSLAVASGQEESSLYFLKQAIHAGVSPKEIIEAMNVVVMMQGQSVIENTAKIFDAAEQYFYQVWYQ